MLSKDNLSYRTIPQTNLFKAAGRQPSPKKNSSTQQHRNWAIHSLPQTPVPVVGQWPPDYGPNNAAAPPGHTRELNPAHSPQGAWISARTIAQASATAPDLRPAHVHSAVCLAYPD